MKAETLVLWFALWLAAIARADTPGITVEGKIRNLAQDATGKIWALREDRGWPLVSLKHAKWEDEHFHSESDTARAESLTKLADGSVACLWSEQTVEHGWIITLHRGAESREWGAFKAEMRKPLLLRRADGSFIITSDSRRLLRISADAKTMRATDLPDDVFIKPKPQQDGSLSKDIVPIRAIEDGLGQLWLWCPEDRQRDYMWRLGGLVRLQGEGPKFTLTRLGEKAPAVCALAVWDADTLAVGIAGAGLFLLKAGGPFEKDALKRMPEPAKDEFKHLDCLFHDGRAWHVIATPQPTDVEVEVSKSLGARLSISQTFHYDTKKPTDDLWRYEDGTWRLLLAGLDKAPAHHAAGRAWARTKGGLVIASDEFAPWFVPDDIKEKPRRLAGSLGFPIRSVEHLAATDDSHVLIKASYGDHPAIIWPMDAREPGSNESRVQILKTRGGGIQDARGRLWCLRDNGEFIRLQDGKWIQQPILAEAVQVKSVGFIPDDRNQAWLLPAANTRTAVCDLATGKWSVFETQLKALEAQLPHGGVRLRVDDHPYYQHAFSRDGRIGGFFDDGDIKLYENGAWKEWTLAQIADKETRLAGPLFFEERTGLFSVPVGERTAWQWHGAAGWKHSDEVAIPRLGTGRGGIEIAVVNDEDEDRRERQSGVRDRQGIAWWLDKDRHLHKSLGSIVVPVLGNDEPNPFLTGPPPQHVLVADDGCALLDTTEFGTEREQIFIRARLAPPETTVEIVKNEADKVHIRLAAKNDGEAWFAWRIDDGGWQPLQKQNDLHLGPLPAGEHHVQARAFNADLTPDAKIASVRFLVRLEADKLFGKLVRELSSADLDEREAAARSLGNLGPSIIPRLQNERQSADDRLRWWLDAILQQIDRTRR